jgi:alginate O-acetyltransferase complex protein AlgJ
VLLLGDSFTNVFSDEGLGWGGGAGLAEQLAYRLQRPVDRVAQNAGGAWAARQALRRELRSDPARLDGARVVVYQFAERELAFGDWREVEWPQRLGR